MGVTGGCFKTDALDVNEATQETNTGGRRPRAEL